MMQEASSREFIYNDRAPMRLDRFLSAQIQGFSRTRIQDLIRNGKARVNARACAPSRLLQPGDVVALEIPAPSSATPQPEEIQLDILYEDSDLLVINKPAGMVVHPAAGNPAGTLVNALLAHCQDLSGIGGVMRPGIVHRLDKLTSGCICVAKNDFAHRHLSRQLASRKMGRTYLAWLSGVLPERTGSIDLPVGRSERNRILMAAGKGRSAVTHWRVTDFAPGLTRVLCNLETGRTHQIRVHFAHIGYPVVGDPAYGAPLRVARLKIPAAHSDIQKALAGIHRQLLHAWKIRLEHPRTELLMEFEAPLPKDFQEFDAVVLNR